MGMLGQVFTLTLFLFFTGHQGQDSTENVLGLSGTALWLQPSNAKPNAHSVQWKMRLSSGPGWSVILTWKNNFGPNHASWVSNHYKERFDFILKSLTLLIKAAYPQDSGFYFLEVTYLSGAVSKTQFQVLVFDHVEKPHLQEQWSVLDRGLCQVVLSCLVSKDGNVSYAWYRGSELIQTPRNLTRLELQVDADGLHMYTCNVSNPVSWASHTVNLTQGCSSDHKQFGFVPFLVSIVVLLIILFLSTLACFCVWRRKRKQSKTSTEEFLTIYADVNDLQIKRNQEQEQQQEQNPPGEGITIYSTIQSQHSASTSQDPVKTIYSLVQPYRMSGSKMRNHNPSFNHTIYEEVGRRQPRAQNPARLSCRELESFHIYS
ncbi:natural killer cell receptor 2B4 isoform X4 [Choloepus didactylus]|uniref:natural killer cell receptor 2B4 isoform X4 n=1 Tax=Choloepus didactylus TaxID=27675 RepID=UPI00189EFA6E|nr:natural killer cell receptor 2B4 isoform X4 [Choloepus didactylus]